MTDKYLTINEAIKAALNGEKLERIDTSLIWFDENGNVFYHENVHGIVSVTNDLEKFYSCKIYHEPLTIERLKKEAVSGETVLVDDSGTELLFVGFGRDERIVFATGYFFLTKTEEEIKNWKIKR